MYLDFDVVGTSFVQVLYLGRAPRTKGTLPNFLKWCRVTGHPLVFRELTSSQWIPGFGASQVRFCKSCILILDDSIGMFLFV